MRLLSHNFLLCNAAKCDKNNFPLHIVVEKSQYRESIYNIENLAKLVKKLDWPALRKTVLELGQQEFPKQPCQELMEDNTFMKRLQRILLDTHILEGRMICPGCNKEYPISNGIPNMIIGE